jgi:hypothetical protein
MAAEPVGKRPAAIGSEFVEEVIERLGLFAGKAADLLLRARGRHDFGGHAQGL